MIVLVTGGTGFIGSHIAQHYLDQGHRVFIMGSENENKLRCTKGKNPLDGKFLNYELNNINWDAIGPIDVLFHQAAISNTMVYDRDHMFDVNFWKSRQLFDQAIEHGVKQIVYASSAAVYGDSQDKEFVEDRPGRCLNVYAESKLLLDKYVEILAKTHPEVNIVGLRYSNVYGSNEKHKGKSTSMVTQLIEQIKSGNPTLFCWGEQQRDFVFIEDVVKANILATGYRGNDVFNVGSGIATSFNEVVEVISKYLGINRKINYIENPIKQFYQNRTLLSLKKSKEKLGYFPEWDIDEGVKRLLTQ